MITIQLIVTLVCLQHRTPGLVAGKDTYHTNRKKDLKTNTVLEMVLCFGKALAARCFGAQFNMVPQTCLKRRALCFGLRLPDLSAMWLADPQTEELSRAGLLSFAAKGV